MLEGILKKPISRREALSGFGKFTLGVAALSYAPIKALAAISDEHIRGISPIGYDFLDLEQDFGTVESDYVTLNTRINQAYDGLKNKIKTDPASHIRNEARDILSEIGNILEENGCKYVKKALVNSGLKTGEFDCVGFIAVYLSIAEALGLPMKAASAPGHVFIKFKLADGTYLNWEPSLNLEVTDDEYKRIFSIRDEAIYSGAYFRPLSRVETQAIQNIKVGNAWLPYNMQKAFEHYSTAINQDPRNPSGHFNRGSVYIKAGFYGNALADFKTVVRLDPGNVEAQQLVKKLS